MILGVDSSVVISILMDENHGEAWLAFLLKLRREARLVVCEVVYAELGGLFPSEKLLQHRLSELGMEFDSIRGEAAFLAGQIFAEYRRAGGPRKSLIPDFLIGAHALVQGDGLLTPDRGYLRSYFRKLTIHQPANLF